MTEHIGATAQRKAIRDAVASRLIAAFSGYQGFELFKQQRSRPQESTAHFINIFFHKGEVTHEGDFRQDDGKLIVRFASNIQSDVDDALDSAGLLIEQALEDDSRLSALVNDIEISGWHYGQDEQTGFSWLGYAYQISYETQTED